MMSDDSYNEDLNTIQGGEEEAAEEETTVTSGIAQI